MVAREPRDTNRHDRALTWLPPHGLRCVHAGVRRAHRSRGRHIVLDASVGQCALVATWGSVAHRRGTRRGGRVHRLERSSRQGGALPRLRVPRLHRAVVPWMRPHTRRAPVAHRSPDGRAGLQHLRTLGAGRHRVRLVELDPHRVGSSGVGVPALGASSHLHRCPGIARGVRGVAQHPRGSVPVTRSLNRCRARLRRWAALSVRWSSVSSCGAPW